MKSALVYDRLNKIGGAEEILKALHELYPNSPWYTAVHNPQKTPFTKSWAVNPSLLNKIPFLKNHHELMPFLMPYVFENFDFSDLDLVISTSSAEAKGILTKPKTLHINYCLTPTRYLWSHQDEYLKSSQFRLLKTLLSPLTRKLHKLLKRWDKVAASRPDEIIAISKTVQKRIKKYYHRSSSVIYPPTDTKKFSHSSSFQPEEKDYFLTVSRLIPYKKIKLLIQAFNKTDKTLVIIGKGSEKRRLKRLANSNIHFKGFVPDKELVGYYQNANAFLQANEEDFGIAMVESLASGTPVIAYEKGGAGEIVDKNTGILVKSQTPQAFLQAIEKYATIDISTRACQKAAERFAKEKFKKQFKNKVRSLWQNHQK